MILRLCAFRTPQEAIPIWSGCSARCVIFNETCIRTVRQRFQVVM